MTSLSWHERPTPLTPTGIVGVGEVAISLARRVLLEDQPSLFQSVAAKDLLVVLHHQPPWVDGGVFIGVDPDAPGLYLPTWMELSVHPQLVARALRDKGLIGPVVLLPHLNTAVPIKLAGRLDPKRLLDWLDQP